MSAHAVDTSVSANASDVCERNQSVSRRAFEHRKTSRTHLVRDFAFFPCLLVCFNHRFGESTPGRSSDVA